MDRLTSTREEYNGSNGKTTQGGVMPSVMGKDFLTVKQASERSGYSAEYIRRLIRNDKLEAKKVGTVYFVKVESLDSYTPYQKHPSAKIMRCSFGNTTSGFPGTSSVCFLQPYR